jgi:hypothetical protein
MIKMDKVKYKSILKKYLPEAALERIIKLLEKYPIHLDITKERLTKLGDFKISRNGQPKITVNHNLNKYSFLITLLHELAHFTTYKKYKRVKPHGKEWKNEFRNLSLPFLNNFVFPNDILSYFAQYLKNPKAATGSDMQLSMALNNYNNDSNQTYLFQLKIGDSFKLKNKMFILGDKRRTRFEALEINTKKKYLIHQNAEVELIEK